MHRCPLALIMFCIVFEFHAASSQHLFGEHMHWALNNHAPILFSLMTDPFLCPTLRLCQSLTTSPLSRGSLTMHRPPVRSPGRPVADWQTHEESRRWKNPLQNRRVSITDRAAGRQTSRGSAAVVGVCRSGRKLAGWKGGTLDT